MLQVGAEAEVRVGVEAQIQVDEEVVVVAAAAVILSKQLDQAGLTGAGAEAGMVVARVPGLCKKYLGRPLQGMQSILL